jgi:hypothetical protein
VPRGGSLDRQLSTEPPPSVAGGAAVVEDGPTDERGNLEALGAGEVVLSLPSVESLSREADEVHRVIAQAGTGIEPLLLVIEAAEVLREEELAPVVEAAAQSERPVILRVVRNA